MGKAAPREREQPTFGHPATQTQRGNDVMIYDEAVLAERLREWVHKKYGKWITHATALSAVRELLRPTRTGGAI
jgi:hypothetical protein